MDDHWLYFSSLYFIFSDSKKSKNLKPLSSDKPSDVKELIYHYSFTGRLVCRI